MKLTNEQIKILTEWKLDGSRFYLQWQLDRKQYVSINEVLETIGLKWNRKEKAHVADCSPDELVDAIADMVETGEAETLKDIIKKFQFYETPREVAEYLVTLADIKSDDYVCEPSSWHWAIADCMKYMWDQLHVYEIDPVKCKVLEDKWFKVHNVDWLECNNISFDKIVANPPFSKSQDVKHILHMAKNLTKGGRLVSIASSSIQTRQWKLYDELRDLDPKFIDLPEWSFRESGTMVNTVIVLIDNKNT